LASRFEEGAPYKSEMTWNLYRHSKGMHYLGLGNALHSESKELHTVYRCLYENDLAKTWIRPTEMFEGTNDKGEKRFDFLARLRVDYLEEETHRGTRYLLETQDGTSVCNLNVIRFSRGLLGIASVATAPDHRQKGYAQLLIKAVLELKRFEEAEDVRFILFSEVNPSLYEGCGFRVLEAELQAFKPALAMATGSAPLTPHEATFLKRYF